MLLLVIRQGFELWRGGKVPDLNYVRVFGCAAYAFDEKYKNKLDPRSNPMIVIGNSETGYILKDLTTGSNDEYRNVLIDETLLYKHLTNTPSIPIKPIIADEEEECSCSCDLQESGEDEDAAVEINLTEVFETEAVNVPQTYKEAMNSEEEYTGKMLFGANWKPWKKIMFSTPCNVGILKM